MNASALTAFVTHIPTDWIVLAAFAVAASIEAIKCGSGRTTAFALSLPLALIALQWLPATSILGPLSKQFSTPMLQAVLFLLFAAVFFALTYRIVKTYSPMDRAARGVGAGLAAAAALAVVWLRAPALVALWHPNPQISALFGASYGLLWLLGALFILAAARA